MAKTKITPSSTTSVKYDCKMQWVDLRCPQLSVWRDYAIRWVNSATLNRAAKLLYLNIFFEKYLFRLSLPTEPAVFLDTKNVWPSFHESVCLLGMTAIREKGCNDTISDFLRWILNTDFSAVDEYGDKEILPEFRNPVRRIQKLTDRHIDDEGLRAHNDKRLRWLTQLYPELADWRRLAVEWMDGQTGTPKPRLQALQGFFRELIIEHKLPTEPRAFFDSSVNVPDYYTEISSRRVGSIAKRWTTHVRAFTNWVLINKFSEVTTDGSRVTQPGLVNPITSLAKKSLGKSSDVQLRWITTLRPELELWRYYAADWLSTESKGVDLRLKALVTFFERYLVGLNIPSEPAFLFRRNAVVPDFYATCCAVGKDGNARDGDYATNYNNRINEFLEFVLKKYFSAEDDEGFLVISPAFRNPVPYRSHNGGWAARESVHSPLPLGFIEDMRLMLCQGPNFRDWLWAQDALGGDADSNAGDGSDWYSVNEGDIDKDDPDCVWRVRHYVAGHTDLQMWSPVRWVGLLIKLQIPLRMMQVRMLDSGEADTWRYSNGEWVENKNPIAEGTERNPLAQGVFRRVSHLKDVTATAILYANTNKTADQKKSGPAKGYEIPWPVSGPIHQNPFYWLERLRNWQEKYNPIKGRTSWSRLRSTHIQLKSAEQLATYPDACFLFRTRELPLGERDLPMNTNALNSPWFHLLSALQEKLVRTGQLDAGDVPYAFVPPLEERRGPTTYFPMQCLRVSLITALALDGLVPFPILQKLVGHSRLLMTLYYTKMGPAYMGAQLEEGIARLETTKAGTIKRFAAEASYEALLKKTVYNSASSLQNTISEDTGARNAAGWMLLHNGMCVVGGNTSEVEENRKIGGCHNGGPNLGNDLVPKWAPVPGGSRNCVQCRWFMTQPQYLPSLVATFNNHAYHFDEARNACIMTEDKLQELRKIKYEVEASNGIFEQMPHLLELERLYELAMKRFSDLAEKLVATWRLIDRCSTALKDDLAQSNQLIAVGDVSDIKVAFEESESELLQLSGVCEGVEVYPDLDAGKAVFRRSQLLDLALCRDGSAPVFMTMSEADQLACGNAFMRQLAQHVSPTNTQLGMRQVVELMDSGNKVGEMLGLDLSRLVPVPGSPRARVFPIRPAGSTSAEPSPLEVYDGTN